MKDETKYIKLMLPDHYTCEPRDNGVHCCSDIGINDITEEGWWKVFIAAIQVRYEDRFMEIFHQTCTNHKEFTVFLRPESNQ